MGQRLRLGNLRFLRGRDTKWHRDIASIFTTVDGFIDKAIERRSSPSAKSKQGFSLVDHYLDETSDKAEVRAQLMSVFFGSRDQIAISMSLLMFALARHPDVWLKLRQEVLSYPLSPSTESTGRLLYTRKVIYEGTSLNATSFSQTDNLARAGLRLYSPVLWSIKHCNADCILPRGGGKDGQAPILLSAGAVIELNIHG